MQRDNLTSEEADDMIAECREALENGDAILVEVDGVAMRVVEIDEKGILLEGGRTEQHFVAFDQIDDIGWIIGLY